MYRYLESYYVLAFGHMLEIGNWRPTLYQHKPTAHLLCTGIKDQLPGVDIFMPTVR